MNCYKCGKRTYKKYLYCPYCGTLLHMHSKKVTYKLLSDENQADRIEQKLDKLLKLGGLK